MADFTGFRVGKLTVLRKDEDAEQSRMWVCECDCGTVKSVRSDHFTDGRVLSCGCHRIQKNVDRLTTHGRSSTREYRIWRNMKNRCEWDKWPEWHLYGGRGVRVCKEWSESFEAFFSFMGESPTNKHSIDRIDPYGNYEPGNCKWSTPKEQANNTRAKKAEHGVVFKDSRDGGWME